MKTHLIILSIAFILHSYHAGSQCNQSQNVGLFYGNNNGNESIDLMLGVRKLGNGNNATCSENFRFITSFANGVANFKNWTHASNAWHTFIRDGANGGLNMARVGGNPTENVFILFDAAINDNVKIKFSSNANSYLNSGNLGIGTQSPTGRLHILGDPSDNDAGLTSPGGYLVLGSTTGPNLALDNNEIMARSNGVMTSLGLQADGGAIMIHGSSANESEKVLINSAGLVGIGNTNPQAYLHIKQAPDKPYAIKLERPGAGHVPYELFIGSSQGLNIKNSQTGNVDMVFGGNQTIGIGTLAPQALLHLKQYDQKGLRFERDGYKKYELRLDNSNGLHIFNVDDSRDEMVFDGNGNVAIGGTAFPNGYKLAVNGKIITNEVNVQLTSQWPDYVFEENYALLPLHELEKSIQVNGHLPGIPKADEIEAKGIEIGEMQRLLLEKVEELTLYILQLKQENDALKSRIETLEK